VNQAVQPTFLDPHDQNRRADGMDDATIRKTSGTRSISPWILLAVVWVLSAWYMGRELKRGWLPHDDGVLAQSAERVLRGEIPHRDFDEIYTGGESYLNAAAFQLFGTNLASMRYMLYAFFLAWVPAIYYIASRFATPWIAALFTLLAVAWSVPNYPTPMPSWYNLFFATFGVASLCRYIESKQRMWLFFAGLCGGVSFLVKLSGMYYVAGAVLFLLSSAERTGRPVSQTNRWALFALATIYVLGYEALVFSLLRKVFYPGSFFYFFVPIVMVGAAVIWQRLRARNLNCAFESVLANLLLFGAGVALPVVLFLIPYMHSGAIADFVRGVFVLPGRRLHYTIRTQSLPRFLTGTAADIFCLIAMFGTPKKVRMAAGSLLVAEATVLVIMARYHVAVYNAVWVPVWNMMPVLIGAGVLLLMARAKTIHYEEQQKIFMLLAVTAACNLIQFPYSASIYFCYVVPLLILCVLGLGNLVDKASRPILAGVFGVALLYAVWDLTPRFLLNRGEPYAPTGPAYVLPRGGGLRLYSDEARENAEVVSIIAQHARGNYIYATPDCPQVYFLSGFRNPTRTLFDFMDEPAGRTQRILASLHAHDVNLVVINYAAGFSGPLPQDLREEIDKEFPERTNTENYEIRWKP
jgi:hypothetical protein